MTEAKPENRGLASTYRSDRFFDEMYDAQDKPRAHYARIHDWLRQGGLNSMEQLQRMADLSLLNRVKKYNY